MKFHNSVYVPKTMLIMILSSILLFGASCAGRSDIPPGKTRIEFWTISLKPTYNDYINGIIDSYHKIHPDVVVEWIDIPESVMTQKMMAAIAGGVPPDVINLIPATAQIMAQNQALVCMDDVVPLEKKSLYFENLWNSANYDGKSYGIPWYVTTRVIMYNREIFKEAGLDPQKPPKTWKEVDEYAAIIKQKTGKYGYMPAVKIFEDFAIQGIPLVTPDRKKAIFNCPEGVEIIQWYVDKKNQGIMPVETLSEGYKGALNRYQSGRLGIIIAGPTLLLKIKKDAPEVYNKTAVAPMPLGKGKVIPAATMNVVVPRSSKNRKIAVDFALFLTNDVNQLAFCKLVPLLPSTIAAASDEFFTKGKGEPLQDEAIRISIKQLAIAGDMSLGLKNSAQLSRAMNEALEAAYYGQKSSKEALDEAASKWNAILNR